VRGADRPGRAPHQTNDAATIGPLKLNDRIASSDFIV
jgi:hypothetical protein